MGAPSIACKPPERHAAARRGLKKSPVLQAFFASSVYGNKGYSRSQNGACRHGMPQKIARGAGGPGGRHQGLGPCRAPGRSAGRGGLDVREAPAQPGGSDAIGPLPPRSRARGGNPQAGSSPTGQPGRPTRAVRRGRPAPPVFAAFCRLGGRIKRPKEAVPMPNFRWAKP